MTKAQAETFVPTHLGIWVDIFPIDNVVDDEKLFSKQKKKKAKRWHSIPSLASDLTSRYGRTEKRKDLAAFTLRLLHPFLSAYVERKGITAKALRKCGQV